MTIQPINNLNILALICARSGSKGIKNKNLQLMAGKPLVVHSVEAAIKNKHINKVVVSTDSAEIAEVVIAGAEAPFLRDAELSTDEAAEWEVFRDALDRMDNAGFVTDVLVSLPPTSPLRSDDDITNCIDLLIKNNCDAVVCVCDSYRNPEFNMVTLDQNGFASLAIRSSKRVSRRQEASNYFDISTACYAFKPEYIRRAKHIFDGNVMALKIPKERSVDIDEKIDLHWAEFLSRRNGSRA